MTFPKGFLFTKEHEWLDVKGTQATIGITSFAIEQMGDVVHVDLPSVGQKLAKGDSFGTVESTKTVSDLYMPIGGTITEVNSSLLDSPEVLAEDPHGAQWLVKIDVEGNPEGLLNVDAYEKYVAEEASH